MPQKAYLAHQRFQAKGQQPAGRQRPRLGHLRMQPTGNPFSAHNKCKGEFLQCGPAATSVELCSVDVPSMGRFGNGLLVIGNANFCGTARPLRVWNLEVAACPHALRPAACGSELLRCIPAPLSVELRSAAACPKALTGPFRARAAVHWATFGSGKRPANFCGLALPPACGILRRLCAPNAPFRM